MSASKTLIATLKAVTGELGFPQPQTVMASSVNTDIQLRSLTVAACDELLDILDWQDLVKRHTFTAIANQTLYPLPADYHRMISETFWKAGDIQALSGSTDPSTWEALVARSASWTPGNFRIVGNRIEVFPTPTAGQVFTFAYISNNYVIDGTNSLPKAEFSLDSDATVFHARLLINFVKLKMLQAKNLDTRMAAQDFNQSLEAAKANDIPNRSVSINPTYVKGLDNHQLYDLLVRQ